MHGTLTILIDNLSDSPQIRAEHGFSALIEANGRTILFDTGQTDGFLVNAHRMGKSITTVDTVVISHGHYDHAGGIRSLLDLDIQPVCFTGKGFFTPKYGDDPGNLKYLGVDFTRKDLADAGWDHRVVDIAPYRICDGIWILTGFERKDPYEVIPSRFLQIDDEGNRKQDLFEDEIMLVIEGEKGLVLIVGCSHPGICNMLATVKTMFHKPIFALIGGTHLRSASLEHIDHVADMLEQERIELIGLSHCTGDRAVDLFRNRGLNVNRQVAGSMLEW